MYGSYKNTELREDFSANVSSRTLGEHLRYTIVVSATNCPTPSRYKLWYCYYVYIRVLCYVGNIAQL